MKNMSINERRQLNMDNYNTYDPLYMDLFKSNELTVSDIYNNDDKWRNVIINQIDLIKQYMKKTEDYIRIENNILITDKGNIDLMADIPVEAAHIEEIMNG